MNAYRGETPFVVGSRTYVLRFTTNAQAALEGALGEYGAVLTASLMRGSSRAVRGALWAALTSPSRGAAQIAPSAPGRPVTLEAIGDLIDEAGGPDAVMPTYWLFLVNAGIIDREFAEEAGLVPKVEGRPGPKDQAGTGSGTTAAAAIGASI